MIRMNIDSRAKGRLVDAVTVCRQRQPADAFPADEAPHMNRRTAVRCALATMLLWCSAAIHAEQHTVPLFVMSSPGSETQGVLRLVSKVETASTVAIHVIDEAGGRSGPATLTLNALAAVDLSATELQSGNAAKGLLAGLGDIVGDVRLVIDSDMPIVSSAYVRGADGALSAMNATAIQAMAPQPAGYRYDVAVFHPASHATQPSRLRLSNPNDTEAQVAIDAWDDTGAAASGGTVRLTLPPGGARSLTSQQLEAGDAAVISGRLGAGVGNWRLSVSADSPIQVMNVAVGAVTAYWSNLSTTAVAGWAPQDAASFEARFLDRRIVSRDGQDRLELRILAGYRFRDVDIEDGVESPEEGRYGYERTGRDAGRLSIESDSGDRCETNLYFASSISGWYASGCIDGIDRVETSNGGPWLTLDAAAAALDLGSGPDDRTYTAGTAIDPLTLPAASGGDGALTYSLSPRVPGLNFDPATRQLTGTPTEAEEHLMTYRVRDASGDTDWRYFNISVETATGGQETVHGVGDTLSDLPAGSWSPDVTSPAGASFSSSGGNTTVRLDEGGYIEEGNYRYTCQSAGGCLVENRRVTSGSVVQTAKGTAPGSGSGDHGDDRATATAIEAGSDTPGVLTAGDVDYFSIEVGNSGTLEAYTSGRTDTYGYLEDAAGETLRSNDDGGAGTNFRISEDVSAGTYYVRVRGNSSRTTGDYTLHVRFAESDTGTTPPSGGMAWRLTDHDASDRSPSWSPDGQRIAFTSDRDGNLGVYVMDADGANPRRLTDHDAWDGYQSWSPDGRRIAFQSYRDGNWEVYVMDAAGGNPQRLTDHDASDGNPSWSPDGQRIAFTSDRDGNLEVYVMDADGRNPRRLTDHDAWDAMPSWSPDGQRIAFESDRDGNLDVYVMDADGANPRRLTDHDAWARFPSWSPDGQRIAFESDRDGNREVYVMDADGANPRRLTDHDASDGAPSWSPDGRRIAFESDRDGNFEVYVMDADGDGTVQDPQPHFAAGAGVGNRTYTVGTAISALTLPGAGGGGPRTYSLSPEVPGLIFNATAGVRELTGTPTSAGTYDMTYRVRDADGDTDSLTFTITVTGADPEPDLVVESLSVSDSGPTAGATFTLRATVRNLGDGQSGATTLRYYRSTNSTISTSDTTVGTDEVGALSPSSTSAESISLTAPSGAGTYYYGACVDSVSGESNTANNCSSAVSITVSGGAATDPPPSPTNVRATNEGSNVRVRWNASPGATHYEVWRCIPSFGSCISRTDWSRRATVTGTSWLDTSVPAPAPGIRVQLSYIVQACNSAGCSGPL